MTPIRSPWKLIWFLCVLVILMTSPRQSVAAAPAPPPLQITVDDTTSLRGAANPTAEPGTDGPDLDLGYNNYLELVIAVRSAMHRDVKVIYVCTRAPGTTAPQIVTIPAAKVIGDGAPHTYRIDMSLEVWWRGRVQSIAVEPPAKLLYAKVGDGEPQQFGLTFELPDWRGQKSAQSKHFRIYWGKGLSELFTAEQAHGTLRNFEECWQYYVKALKLKPPYSLPGESPNRLYKVNITTHEGGYMTGGGVVNIDPTGLRVDPPSWIIPHELMHAFQEAQRGGMTGMWWESHANYGRERYLKYFYPQQSDNPDAVNTTPVSSIDPYYSTMSQWFLAHGRDYYLCWPIWTYLDENPDLMPGLSDGFTGRLWQNIQQNENIFDCIRRLDPRLDLKTALGNYARRSVTWAFSNGPAMRRACEDFRTNPQNRRMLWPDLLPVPYAPGRWRVSPEKAPNPGGYTIHELVPADGHWGSRVAVEFHGLPDKSASADWRACIVAQRRDGSETAASPLFDKGTQAVSLPADTDRVFLVVIATPDQFAWWEQDDMQYPWRTHPSRRRLAYDVKISGAVPALEQIPRPADVPGRRHPNGGGFVANTAHVADTAFVGPGAMVLDSGRVEGSARIEDFAQVRGDASVKDNAILSDHALVKDDAVIDGNARVRDYAFITEHAHLTDDARALQTAEVKGHAIIKGTATVEGCVQVWGDGQDGAATSGIDGDAVLTADYGGPRHVSNGFQTGFVPYEACPQEWIDQRHAPPHRWVSYDFDAPNDSLALDGPGLNDGILIGRPLWKAGEGRHTGFLSFDGRTQAVFLERGVADLRIASITAWVRRESGPADQPVWFIGSQTDDSIHLTPDEGRGRFAVVARKGNTIHTLVSRHSTTIGTWVHVAVILDGVTGRLLVDGTVAADGPFPVTLADFRPPAAKAHCYLARQADPSRPWFHGSLDEVRFWSAALSDEEVKNTMAERP